MLLYGFACVCMSGKQALKAVFLFNKRLLKRYQSAFFVVCTTKCKNAFCTTNYIMLLYFVLHSLQLVLHVIQTTKLSGGIYEN